MNNCLVTRLKAVVDDSTLPVIEVMKQFTIDAIALSGNESMTDDQKLALNHFFYQVGAMSNNELWQKIKYIFLPVIAGTVFKAKVNYKTLSLMNGTIPSDVTLDNGGLHATGNTVRNVVMPISFSDLNPNDISVYASLSNSIGALPQSASSRFTRIKEADSGNGMIDLNITSYQKTPQINFTQITSGARMLARTSSFLSTEYVASILGDDDNHTYFVTIKDNDNNFIECTNSYVAARIYNGTATDGVYQIVCPTATDGFKVSASIVGSAITDAERDILTDAVTTLKKSFIV